MARPEGSSNLSSNQINKIIEMTEEGKLRPEIAEEVGCSKVTVWRWQKKYDLL